MLFINFICFDAGLRLIIILLLILYQLKVLPRCHVITLGSWIILTTIKCKFEYGLRHKSYKNNKDSYCDKIIVRIKFSLEIIGNKWCYSAALRKFISNKLSFQSNPKNEKNA